MTSFKRITIVASAFFFTALLCNLFGWGDDDTVSVVSGDYHSVTSTSHNNCWCITADEDTVHAVWCFRKSPYEVWYARSYDSTETWEDSVKLSGSEVAYWPAIAMVGDTIHAVWRGGISGYIKILYAKSTDRGANWDSAINIADDSASYKYYPCIRANGSNVYIAWRDNRGSPTGYKIYFDRSTNNGSTWGSDTIVGNILESGEGDACDFPSMSVYGSNVDVAWEYLNGDSTDYEIFHRRSTNGAGWGSLHNITNCDSVDQTHPSIATSSSYVLVVYTEPDSNAHKRIVAARSNNGGSNWWMHYVDYADSNYWQDYASVAYVGVNAHVVWEDSRRGEIDIRYAPSYNSGWSWASSAMISASNTYDSRKPTIESIVDDDDDDVANCYVAWTEMYTARFDYYEVLADFNQYDIIVGMDPQQPGGGQLASDADTRDFTSKKVLISPNPMKSQTTVEYILPEKQQLRIEVFDVSGRLVKAIFAGTQEPGIHHVLWDGKNNRGKSMEAGVYFIKVIGIGESKVIKL